MRLIAEPRPANNDEQEEMRMWQHCTASPSSNSQARRGGSQRPTRGLRSARAHAWQRRQPSSSWLSKSGASLSRHSQGEAWCLASDSVHCWLQRSASKCPAQAAQAAQGAPVKRRLAGWGEKASVGTLAAGQSVPLACAGMPPSRKLSTARAGALSCKASRAQGQVFCSKSGALSAGPE